MHTKPPPYESRDIVRHPAQGGDDVRPVEVDGRTISAVGPLDEAADAIERWREQVDRDDALEQTVVVGFVDVTPVQRLASSPGSPSRRDWPWSRPPNDSTPGMAWTSQTHKAAASAQSLRWRFARTGEMA
jgi:hypothetical protein